MRPLRLLPLRGSLSRIQPTVRISVQKLVGNIGHPTQVGYTPSTDCTAPADRLTQPSCVPCAAPPTGSAFYSGCLLTCLDGYARVNGTCVPCNATAMCSLGTWLVCSGGVFTCEVRLWRALPLCCSSLFGACSWCATSRTAAPSPRATASSSHQANAPLRASQVSAANPKPT